MFQTIDIIAGPIFLLTIIVCMLVWRNLAFKYTPVKKFFLPGLFLKICGVFIVIILNQLYEYIGGGSAVLVGDASYYYRGGSILYKSFFENPQATFILLLQKSNVVVDATQVYKGQMVGSGFGETYFMYKISGFIGLITLANSFFVTSLVLGVFSFTGLWVSYVQVCKKFPKAGFSLAIAFFCIPSVLMWTGTILKGTVCLGCLGWFYYAAMNLFEYRKKIVFSIIIMIITSWVILHLKAYIIIAFFPSLLLYFYMRVRNGIRSVQVRLITSFLLIPFLLIGGLVMVKYMSEISGKYALENIEKTAQGFQGYHTRLSTSGNSGGGSAYSLPISDFTPTSMIKVFPLAVNVTLFRPYLFEVSSPAMALAALESSVFIILLLLVIVKFGLIRFVITSVKNPTVICFLTYSIILAFASGLVSYNFGALTRFRAPILPFFICAIILIYHINRKKKIEGRVDEAKV